MVILPPKQELARLAVSTSVPLAVSTVFQRERVGGGRDA